MAPSRRGRVVKRAPLERGDYAVEDLPGFSCIRQRSSGERMHGGLEPAAEAALLYVEPSGLPSRLFEGEEPLVIWDVGLGAAANAMGVILEVERLSALFPGRPMRTVQLVSFEQDLDPFRLLASHPERFPQARHAAPLALLKSGQWTSTRAPLHWQLLEGDFASRLEHAPAPDLLYYDPFSPRTDGPLWTWSFFSKLFQCLTAASAGRTTTLLTYSNATPVRAALLAAGFWVAYGPPTGARPDTTRAYTLPVGGEVRWLEVDWLQRWARSGARVPEGLDPGERLSFETRIWTHPQFRRSPDGWTQTLAEAYFRLSVDAHAGGASDRAAAFGERAVEGFRTLQNSDGLRKALASQRIYLKALAESTALEIVEGQLAALSAERQASRGTND
jgi:queuine tRNA-ribosyltransferase